MTSVRQIFFLLTAAGFLGLAACQSPFERTGPKFDARKRSGPPATNAVPVEVTPQAAPEIQAAQRPFTLGPGDKLEIEIIGDPTSRALVTVGPDGKIYYYLLPGLDVWGLTLAQTRELIHRELGKFMTTPELVPEVALTLRGIESKRIWMLGRLHNSGVYPIGAPMTLLESISMAGGLLSSTTPGPSAGEELADLRHSFVIRQGQVVPVDFYRLIRDGDMTQNIYLQPEDFVYVPSAVSQEIYVLGAVRVPKPTAWSESMTLVAAIASSGGTIKDAYLTHVGIVRGSMTKPQIAVVDYKEIVSGKAPDVRLEPRDIVYIPFTPYKTLVKYTDLILATFARAVAINEGARAVSRNVSPVGVQIGIGVR
jgi:protein involved in polysaccharide export with SLBB domain